MKKTKKGEVAAEAASSKSDAFKAPGALPTNTKKTAAQSKGKSKKNSDMLSDGGSDTDSSISVGYPSSIPSTPQDSSDFSFSSDFSDSDEGDESSVSMDEFANNTLEIKLDSKTTDALQAKLKNKKASAAQPTAESKSNRGVIVLSHIPFGFFEDQMKSFFEQFGTVTRLRLSRAKRSGRSRGYAFVEFSDAEVAAIVAETMNDYLMYGRRLKCQVVPPEKVHPNTFKGRRPRTDITEKSHLAHRLSHNRTKTQQEMDRNVRKLIEKEEKRRKKLEAAGIDYEFDGFAAQAPADLPDIATLSKKKSETSKSK